MKKLLLMIGAAALMAACSEAPSAPSAQRRAVSPSARANGDLTCRSGYIVAYDQNGNPYCSPDGQQSQTTTGATAAAHPAP